MSYSLWFGFDETSESFRGRAAIQFQLLEDAEKAGSNLVLDFRGEMIESLTVNGAARVPERTSQSLVLPVRSLVVGANRIEIAYAAKYAPWGKGLTRYQDPLDGKVYLYGLFQPFSAHAAFPCFDQPDLKATFETSVDAPATWFVSSHSPEREVGVGAERKTWSFPATPPFSPYAFSLAAGPFVVSKTERGGVPIRFLVRSSQSSRLQPAAWSDLLAKGIAFFGERFGYPYPYGKLDQVFVPMGMHPPVEAIGSVLLSEQLLNGGDRRAGSESHEVRRKRTSLVLQGLAKLWFGNLVTMRWWNGLWLRDSFALYSATWALEHAFGDADAWLNFAAGPRARVSLAERLAGAHPVDRSITDSEQIGSGFEVFTVDKGAVLLRQVVSWVGEDAFQDSLQRYFPRYAHRVATLGDFSRVLEESSDLPAQKWQRSWLQTAGENRLEATWTCEKRPTPPEGERPRRPRRESQSGFRLKELLLRQTGRPGSSGPRYLRVKVALLGVPGASKGGEPKVIEQELVGAETRVSRAEGGDCPTAVVPNWDDGAAVTVRLDPVSQRSLFEQPSLFRALPAAVRLQLWRGRLDGFWDGLDREGNQLMREVSAALRSETHPEVWNYLATMLVGDERGQRLSLFRVLPPKARAQWARSAIPLLKARGGAWARGVAHAYGKDPRAGGTPQERAALRFWEESGEQDELEFGHWLAGQQALGQDGEELEALAFELAPLHCGGQSADSAIPTGAEDRFSRLRQRLRSEGALCGSLRASAFSSSAVQ